MNAEALYAEMIQRHDTVIRLARMELESATKDMAREFDSIALYASKGAAACRDGLQTNFDGNIADAMVRIAEIRIRQAKAAEALRALSFVVQSTPVQD